MFDNLIQFDPDTDTCTPVVSSDAPPRVETLDGDTLLAAQRASAQWLVELGAPDDEEVDADLGRRAARNAFTALTAGDPPEKARDALLSIRAPAAVQHLTAMLTAYDWEFVQHAKDLRNYVVGRLLEESDTQTGGKAADRIKALQALGKVTEVGLFTEKLEIVKKDMSDEELDAKIKDRMERLRRVYDAVPRPMLDAQPADAQVKE